MSHRFHRKLADFNTMQVENPLSECGIFLKDKLVPYSRKSVTQFSPPQSVWIKKNTHAVRGIKNKKSAGFFEIRMLKKPPRHLSPSNHGD
jgi:hypothetical protein